MPILCDMIKIRIYKAVLVTNQAIGAPPEFEVFVGARHLQTPQIRELPHEPRSVGVMAEQSPELNPEGMTWHVRTHV